MHLETFTRVDKIPPSIRYTAELVTLGQNLQYEFSQSAFALLNQTPLGYPVSKETLMLATNYEKKPQSQWGFKNDLQSFRDELRNTDVMLYTLDGLDQYVLLPKLPVEDHSQYLQLQLAEEKETLLGQYYQPLLNTVELNSQPTKEMLLYPVIGQYKRYILELLCTNQLEYPFYRREITAYIASQAPQYRAKSPDPDLSQLNGIFRQFEVPFKIEGTRLAREKGFKLVANKVE